MTPKPPIVILWVHPRSTSTMFECAILNKEDEFRVLHEPMGGAWYFGPERQATRFSQQEIDEKYPQYKSADYKSEWSNVVKSPDGKRTFSKDMAQYILTPRKNTGRPVHFNTDPENPTLIPTDQLLSPDIVHTFLIRSPEKAVPSYYRLCSGEQSAVTDFHFYEPDEAGYHELRTLFDYVKKNSEKTPLLIDSDDLIADPKHYLKLWCDYTGVDYADDLLEWNKGTRDHFAKWPGFHTAAEQSQGVGRGLEKSQQNHIKTAELPPEAQRAILDNQDDYLYLKKFAM